MDNIVDNLVKVACYCRVSTFLKPQKNSFDNQKAYWVEYTKEHNYLLEEKHLYADEGLSGTGLKKRKQFIRMLVSAGLDVEEKWNDEKTDKKLVIFKGNRKPLFQTILCSNSSRFGRNELEVKEVIKALRLKGVNVIFIDKNLNTANDTDMEYLDIMFKFDERESKEKSLKVREGYKKSVEVTTKIHTNKSLFGYKYIKEENRLETIEREAEIIKQIFSMYVDGFGMRRIINKLTEEKKFNRKGNIFSKTTIGKMLSNPVYMGKNYRLRYDTGIVLQNKHYGKLKDRTEWVEIEDVGKIPRIIEPSLFDKAQEVRKKNTIVINNEIVGYNKPLKGKFSSLLVCGECGSMYHSNIDKGRRFYNCAKKKLRGLNACNNYNVSEKILDEQVKKLCKGEFYNIVTNDRNFNIERLNSILEDLTKRIDNQDLDSTKELAKKIKEIDGKINKNIDLLEDGVISKDILYSRIEAFKSEKEKLQEELYNIGRDNNQIKEDINNILNTITDLKKIKLKKEYTKDEIMEQIEQIEVLNDYENNKMKLVYDFKITSKMYELLDKYDSEFY